MVAEPKRAAALWPAGRWREQQRRPGLRSSFRLTAEGKVEGRGFGAEHLQPPPSTPPHRRSFREDALAAADAGRRNATRPRAATVIIARRKLKSRSCATAAISCGEVGQRGLGGGGLSEEGPNT